MKKLLKTKKFSVLFLLVCLALIFVTTVASSAIQTSFGRVDITQISEETNTGTKLILASDKAEASEYTVTGKVQSGLLYVPKNAYKTPAPGIAMVHGAFNNKEMQEAFGIEMARRGYVVLLVDAGSHGDNETTDSTTLMSDACKYLYNLTDAKGHQLVDKNKIGVSGHSMGGGYANTALQQDGVDTVYSVYNGNTDAALKAGFHMGIISAGAPEAADPDASYYGSNVLGVAAIKGNADEWYYNSEMKEPEYIMISKDFMTQEIFNKGLKGEYLDTYAYNPTSFSMQWSGSVDGKLYVKTLKGFRAVEDGDKFNKRTQYYKYSVHGNSIYYLRSAEATDFVDNTFDKATFTGEAYSVQNRGIYDYATGKLVDSTQKDGKRLSIARKGEAIPTYTIDATTGVKTVTGSIRVVYEAKETHPMNHFSVSSTASYIDFFYNCFGTPEGARYISCNNQTWIVKQSISIFGFIGLFGLVIALAELLLGTKAFESLRAKEGEVEEGDAILGISNLRKLVSYLVIGLGSCIFGAYSYSQINNNGKWFAHSYLYKLSESNVLKITNISYYHFYNVGMIAYWGIVCGLFAVLLTAFVWFVNHCINVVKYEDKASEYDSHPFAGFKIRKGNILKTLAVVAIITTVFFGIVNLQWKTCSVGFYFWTFGTRHFDADKLLSMLRVVPYMGAYYILSSCLCKGYRTKSLPEWLTIIINCVFAIAGVLVLVWTFTAHNIHYGNMTSYGNSLMYLLSYPIIPSVVISVIVSRRIYTKTGNGWLAGLLNAVIFTIIACANTGWMGMF